MGVSNHRIADAAHQGPAHPATALVAHHYQPFHGQRWNLRLGSLREGKTPLHRPGKRLRREGHHSLGGTRRRLQGVLAQGAEGARHGGVERPIGAHRVYPPECAEQVFCEVVHKSGLNEGLR